MTNQTRDLKLNYRFQQYTLLISIGLMIFKFLAWFFTSSNAILTDAAESIVNVIAAGLGTYALYLSSLPRDRNHPYGHGKVEFLSAGVEGTMILLASITMISKAVYDLFMPHEIQRVHDGIIIVAIAGLVNYIWGFYIQKRGEKVRSIALEASGKHLKSDAYSTIGLVLGLGILYFFPLGWIDNVLAVLFGTIIFISGYGILRKSVAGIMDEADSELINSLVKNLDENRHSEWIDIHNFRVVKYGSQLHIDAHLTVPWYYQVSEMHEEVDALNDQVNTICGSEVEMFVHVDPCNEDSCAICTLSNCKERKQKFSRIIEWNLSNITKNQKHQLKQVTHEKIDP